MQAIAWKQWLLKRRGAVNTLVGILSPVLVISVLVLAYSLVDPEPRPARIRVEDTERTIKEFRYDFDQWAATTLPEVEQTSPRCKSCKQAICLPHPLLSLPKN